MTDRSIMASGFSVGVAVVGSALGNLALSLAGPLLALLVHLWAQHTTNQAELEKSEYIDHLKARIFQLENEVGQLKGPQTDASKCGYTGRDCWPKPKT